MDRALIEILGDQEAQALERLGVRQIPPDLAQDPLTQQVELLCPGCRATGDLDDAVALRDRGGLARDRLPHRSGPGALHCRQQRRRLGPLQRDADGSREWTRDSPAGHAALSADAATGEPPLTSMRRALDEGTWPASVAAITVCPSPSSRETSSSRCAGSSSLITSSSSISGALRPASRRAARSAKRSASRASRCWP